MTTHHAPGQPDYGVEPAPPLPAGPARTVFHRSEGVTLYTGDAVAALAELPEASVDCVVTSPPYWRLRDYDPDTPAGGRTHCAHRTASATGARRDSPTWRTCRDCGAVREHPQIGLEATAEDYVAALREVFGGARRVLTPRATVWINLGDSYSTNSDGYWRAQPGDRQPHYRPVAGVAHKNLLGMPWQVALALQDDGWILRNAIVWNKPHTTPTSARDRLACRHEMIFLFVRQPDYYFDLDPIRQTYTGDRALSCRAHRGGTTPHTATGVWPRGPAAGERGQNPGNVWTIRPDISRTGHPASSPVEIPQRCIAAGCPPGGHVLDPFSGAATTGVAARQLGRRFTGIDTFPRYHEYALRRLGLTGDDAEGRTT